MHVVANVSLPGLTFVKAHLRMTATHDVILYTLLCGHAVRPMNQDREHHSGLATTPPHQVFSLHIALVEVLVYVPGGNASGNSPNALSTLITCFIY